MKTRLKIFSTIIMLAALSACGPKDIQPIQSLSGVDTQQFNLVNVNVGLSPEFVARVENDIAEEEEYIATQQKRIDTPTGSTSFRKRENAKVAQKNIEKSQKKIVSLKEEMTAVEVDIRAGIKEELAGKFSGNRDIDLDVSINSFALTNGASVVLIGGSDSMTGLVKIKDNQSGDLLGQYHITDMDTNAAGGLLGLMVRGSDPRGDMIKQFSEKIVDVLSGKYSD
ncbi:hypothetical protein [Pseudemcibacter aquimaris]|uniref:hypothetical protein n=1 Tax=Pseudemcibacter aquimaris TaxID=2857064 RepID=UPI0020125D7F|nr:hypothetical protein [Pseudemcibacter aquimaris]MCC3859916.1 hypothetical protein [Pseudemcibacter aquimaris]WDU57248.1 hypothetical protein KW060_08560 [Pseudemcibacter aquimaris]